MSSSSQGTNFAEPLTYPMMRPFGWWSGPTSSSQMQSAPFESSSGVSVCPSVALRRPPYDVSL